MTPVPTLTLEIDGRSYVLRPKEVDAFTAATFRAATGTSVEGLLRSIDTDEDDDLGIVEVAQFAYLATLQTATGESFQEIAAAIRYDSNFGQMKATGLPSDDDDEDGFSLEPDEPEDVPDDLEGPEPSDPTNGIAGSPTDDPAFSPSVVTNSGKS